MAIVLWSDYWTRQSLLWIIQGRTNPSLISLHTPTSFELFPESQERNKYILVISKYLTWWTETTTIPNARAITIATKLMEGIIFPHGSPAHILSDKGPQFSGEVLRELDTQLGIQQIFTSPYHPHTNRLTKRMNKTIKQQLTAFIDPLHTTWDLILPFITQAYNIGRYLWAFTWFPLLFMHCGRRIYETILFWRIQKETSLFVFLFSKEIAGVQKERGTRFYCPT